MEFERIGVPFRSRDMRLSTVAFIERLLVAIVVAGRG
jgi:hypothetical protein